MTHHRARWPAAVVVPADLVRPLGRRVLLALLLCAVAILVWRYRGPVSDPGPATAYDRDAWPHWIDEDGDCQDTRAEVLVAESEVEVTFTDDDRCHVAGGRWRCPYTGRIVTDARELDIDHVVPLAAAHAAGGDRWNQARRRDFANALQDPGHLVAVDASANRSKGSRGPDRWLPSVAGERCPYLHAWQNIEARWSLDLAPAERGAIADGLKACARGGVPSAP